MCYSSYSKNRSTCKTCQYRIWCEDSSNLDKGVASFSYDDLSYSRKLAKEPDQWKDKKSTQPNKLLAELLHEMMDEPEKNKQIIQLLGRLSSLHKASPRTFEIALTKLLYPGLSYNDIAERYGTSKQMVAYYLDRAKKLVPQIESAILIDRRHVRVTKSLTQSEKITKEARSRICAVFGSVKAFSKKTPFSHPAISRWLNGKRSPKHASRVALADSLGLTVDELEEKFGL